MLRFDAKKHGSFARIGHDVTRSRSRTLRGHAALRAAVDWFGPPSEHPEKQRGVPARNDHANREAILSFLADLKARGSRRVFCSKFAWEEKQASYPLCEGRFRPLVGDPDSDGDGRRLRLRAGRHHT